LVKFTFSRNHNAKGTKGQDPSQWPSVAKATQEANLFRYYYLPYLYSIFFDVSMYGGTVVRPVFFEFTTDPETHHIWDQFMWGNAMMIIPVYQQGVAEVSGYLPYTTPWYSLRNSDYATLPKPGYNIFSAPTNDLIPVFARGGVIIPRQRPNTTTVTSRQNPLELLITIGLFFSDSICSDFDKIDGPAKSAGTLYWDDGESIVQDFENYNYFQWVFEFVHTSERAALYITPKRTAKGLTVPSIDILDIIGYHYKADLDEAMLNGKPAKISLQTSHYDSLRSRLLIKTTNLLEIGKAAPGSKLTLSWPHQETGFCDEYLC
uniref:Maltase-glucoamylase, intestinal n=1 Tax=Gongylonema pulchrum TaxID=637853 RepID=A0A183CUI4_9BILA